MRRDDVLRELGLAPIWRLRRSTADAARAGATASTTQAAPAVAGEPDAEPRRARIATLDYAALIEDIAACTACGLCRKRHRTVPGVGDIAAEWMFVGEAPGADEDAQGEPFVGAAGQLLDNMLAALGLERARNVYIANVLKCRPPGNRDPEPLEAQACGPYLDRQIELIAPRLIVALGKSAACRLLDVEASVASLRNRVHRYRGTPLIVTYHPAYLLRSPADKAKAWEDLLFARRTLREAVAAAPK
jgi:DNA polymerase